MWGGAELRILGAGAGRGERRDGAPRLWRGDSEISDLGRAKGAVRWDGGRQAFRR